MIRHFRIMCFFLLKQLVFIQMKRISDIIKQFDKVMKMLVKHEINDQ